MTLPASVYFRYNTHIILSFYRVQVSYFLTKIEGVNKILHILRLLASPINQPIWFNPIVFQEEIASTTGNEGVDSSVLTG